MVLALVLGDDSVSALALCTMHHTAQPRWLVNSDGSVSAAGFSPLMIATQGLIITMVTLRKWWKRQLMVVPWRNGK